MKRQELIDAALLHYSLHGYHGATMRKIATEVGIKPASIYFFFKNKEALFIAAFDQLLNDHFNEMKRILFDNKDSPVETIFSAMLKGIVAHHTGNLQATTAYISLVTSPIPEIKADLQKHMLTYTEWLVDSLEDVLKRDFPLIRSSEVNRIIKQFVLLGNGVFWGINLYNEEGFLEQVTLADQMLHTIFNDIKLKYSQ